MSLSYVHQVSIFLSFVYGLGVLSGVNGSSSTERSIEGESVFRLVMI